MRIRLQKPYPNFRYGVIILCECLGVDIWSESEGNIKLLDGSTINKIEFYDKVTSQNHYCNKFVNLLFYIESDKNLFDILLKVRKQYELVILDKLNNKSTEDKSYYLKCTLYDIINLVRSNELNEDQKSKLIFELDFVMNKLLKTENNFSKIISNEEKVLDI